MGERPLVHLQIVPAGSGAYVGVNGPFVIAAPAQGDEVAYLDNQLKGVVVHSSADVRSLRNTWETLRTEALPRRQSLELMTKVAEEWS